MFLLIFAFSLLPNILNIVLRLAQSFDNLLNYCTNTILIICHAIPLNFSLVMFLVCSGVAMTDIAQCPLLTQGLITGELRECNYCTILIIKTQCHLKKFKVLHKQGEIVRLFNSMITSAMLGRSLGSLLVHSTISSYT